MHWLPIIFACWTPIDSMELAVKHGYVLEYSSVLYPERPLFGQRLRETWNINGRRINVYYARPYNKRTDLFCYDYEEDVRDPNNNEPSDKFVPGKPYDGGNLA